MSENIQSASINWYPGHMAKARREMQEKIRLVDMVIELRDARMPNGSINPVLNEIIGSKPRLIVLAKKDRADSDITARWVSRFARDGHKTIALDLIHDPVNKIISAACQEVMKEKIAKQKARGMKHVEIKAMVVGIPNVGKSTLINSVSRKKMARTADHPGVTKSLQWIKVSPDVALLDTPGVLWPKFEDQEVAMKLALCGSISDNVLPISELVIYSIRYILANKPQMLVSRYGIELSDDPHTVLERIAEARHFLDAEGTLDMERTEAVYLNELRDGLIGTISWEKPDED